MDVVAYFITPSILLRIACNQHFRILDMQGKREITTIILPRERMDRWDD